MGEFSFTEAPSWDGANFGDVGISDPASPSIGLMPSDWDWRGILGTVTSGVGAVATTIGALQQQKLNIQNAREDRSFNQFMRSLSLDTTRAVATSQSEIERIRAQTALAVEQRRLQGAQGAGSFALLSGSGGNLMLYLTIAGLVLAYWSLRKQ